MDIHCKSQEFGKVTSKCKYPNIVMWEDDGVQLNFYVKLVSPINLVIKTQTKM